MQSDPSGFEANFQQTAKHQKDAYHLFTFHS